MRCYATAEAMCEARAPYRLVKPKPIHANRALTASWVSPAMRAKLANAYVRAGGDDEKAARILGVTVGPAPTRKLRRLQPPVGEEPTGGILCISGVPRSPIFLQPPSPLPSHRPRPGYRASLAKPTYSRSVRKTQQGQSVAVPFRWCGAPMHAGPCGCRPSRSARGRAVDLLSSRTICSRSSYPLTSHPFPRQPLLTIL
jgi:hypothetical protein